MCDLHSAQQSERQGAGMEDREQRERAGGENERTDEQLCVYFSIETINDHFFFEHTFILPTEVCVALYKRFPPILRSHFPSFFPLMLSLFQIFESRTPSVATMTVSHART